MDAARLVIDEGDHQAAEKTGGDDLFGQVFEYAIQVQGGKRRIADALKSLYEHFAPLQLDVGRNELSRRLFALGYISDGSHRADDHPIGIAIGPRDGLNPKKSGHPYGAPGSRIAP